MGWVLSGASDVAWEEDGQAWVVLVERTGSVADEVLWVYIMGY